MFLSFLHGVADCVQARSICACNVLLIDTAISRAHSFPRQILPNSAAPFAKFHGSPRQILGIPQLNASAHFRVYCADCGPVMPQN